MTVADALCFYKFVFTSKKHKTSQKNERKYFNYLSEFCKRNGINEINQFQKKHAFSVRDELKLTLSNATINRQLGSYKNFFNELVNRDYAELNPFVYCKLLRVKKPQIELWSDEDFSCVWSFLGKCEQVVFEFMKLSGVRSVEAVDLKWTDINFEIGKITIHSLKNADDFREIPITKQLETFFATNVRCSGGNYVFKNERGTKYTSDTLGKRVREAIDKAAINKKINVKSLRHTYATKLLLQNVSTRNIQELLGHKDERTTQNYLHPDIFLLKEALKSVSV